MERWMVVSRALAAVVLVGSCGGGDVVDPGPVPASVQIADIGTITSLGVSRQLTATVLDASGGAIAGRTVAWSVAPAGVVTVTAQGLLTSVANGQATITATVDGIAGTALATVQQQIVTVSISPGVVDTFRALGAVVLFSATARDSAEAQVAGVTAKWSAAPDTVVSVSAAGVVMALADGDATLQVTIGSATATQPLVVKQRAHTLGVGPGGPVGSGDSLQFTTAPADSLGNPVTVAVVTYSLTDPNAVSIGTIDASGLFHATAAGAGWAVAEGAGVRDSVRLRVYPRYDQITSGVHHTCGLATGRVYCWGQDDEGQLGNGPGAVHNSVPALVVTDSLFTVLAAGGRHTCGLTASGVALCWGLNDHGQLGDGGTTNAHVPVAVVGNHVFIRIAAAQDFSCGVTTNGTAWCWGDNQAAQLGSGSGPDGHVPVSIANPSDFVEIEAGNLHACGITADSTAWCWGSNTDGELGFPTATGLPGQVLGGHRFLGLALGSSFSCGLREDGVVWCWGLNLSGQLGLGVIDSVVHDVPDSVAGGLRFTHLSAGTWQACAVASGGLFCWGWNFYGQLGLGDAGTATERGQPTLVVTGQWKAMGLGAFHSCAVDADAVAWCWGSNFYGQMGTNGSSLVPAVVNGQR